MMKVIKMFFVALVTFASFSASAYRVEGQVQYGPYLNCEIENDLRVPVAVTNYEYTVRLRDGSFVNIPFVCNFNCDIRPFEYKVFSGPANRAFVDYAYCSANVVRLRR